METLKHICNQFQIKAPVLKMDVLASGHINDTYLIACSNGLNYVLQRINNQVFKNSKDIVLNRILVSNHLKRVCKNR